MIVVAPAGDTMIRSAKVATVATGVRPISSVNNLPPATKRGPGSADLESTEGCCCTALYHVPSFVTCINQVGCMI